MLVIGAGACGATAALRAADRGVPTLLIDREDHAFHPQIDCKTRWLDPTQYDWPLDHWNNGLTTWNAAAITLPFAWKAERAFKVAGQWIPSLTSPSSPDARANLRVRFNAQLAWPPALYKNRLYLTLRSAGEYLRESFGMVIVAVGSGSEETRAYPYNQTATATAYRGFRFWQDDPIEESSPRSGIDGGNDRVIISGAGDGALQDFLRITTRMPSARRIYEACRIPAAIDATIRTAILVAEERAQSAMHWNMGRAYDHKIQMELENAYIPLVQRALTARGVAGNLDALLANRPARTDVIHSCGHFACKYPLNRFLALLILEHLKLQDQRPVVRLLGTAVVDVSAVRVGGKSAHVCGLAKDCHGRAHDVSVADQPDCWVRADLTTRRIHQGGPFNVIVIRHGIDERRVPWLSLKPLDNPRQILPYYLLQ